MPNQPRADNPARSVRIDDELWQQVIEAAEDDGGEGTTPAMIVRAAIRQYIAKGTPKPPPPARSG